MQKNNMQITLLTESLLIYNYSQFPKINGILYNLNIKPVRKDVKTDELEIIETREVLYDILLQLSIHYVITLY